MPQPYDLSPICPPASASPQDKLAWLVGSRTRAESNLKNGDAYKTIDQTIDAIACRVAARMSFRSKKKSKLTTNRVKRQLREVIALLTQRIKPSWDYCTHNQDWREHANILTKRLKSWLDTKMFDRILKEVLQWGVTGAGYMVCGWSRAIPGFMDTDLEIDVAGPDDVLRDQGMELQEAYAVHVRKLYNLSEAVSRMPLSRNFLRPVRTRPTTRSQDSRKVAGWLSPLLNAFGYSRPTDDPAGGVNNFGFLGTDVEVYCTYLLDMSINTSGREIHSDELTYDMASGIKTTGTSWEYSVPSLGQQLPLDEAGHITSATAERCLLYPTRRLLIWTEDHLVYDGPSYFWHGRVPVVQVSLDKWPWEQIGYSLAADNISIEEAVNELLRGAVDAFNLKLDPMLMINKKEISEKEGRKIDMREPGGRIWRSGLLPGADVVSPINDGGYEIPQQLPAMVQMLVQTSDHQVGVADVSSLMELQQAPAADATERLLQAQGPLATDYARELERAITEFGILAGWNFLQFDTTQRRLQLLGQDGLSWTDFDYDPGKLLPVDVPGVPLGSTRLQRAMIFGRQFSFSVVPNSIFEFTDTQNMLMKFQLWRDGRFPIDPWTVAEALNLGNFGQPKGDSIMTRWVEWMQMSSQFQAEVMAKAQATSQQIMMQAQAQIMQDPRMQALMMLQQAAQGGGSGGGQSSGAGSGPGAPTQNGHPGRPPSGERPPHLEQKGTIANPRNSTIAES